MCNAWIEVGDVGIIHIDKVENETVKKLLFDFICFLSEIFNNDIKWEKVEGRDLLVGENVCFNGAFGKWRNKYPGKE